MSLRLDYEASCRKLHKMDWQEFLPPPPIPDRKPQPDDEVLGVNFFRTLLQGDLSGLTLPRTFFGRSEISNASFRDTDLRESNLCWNDFTDVDFGGAILTGADLRASSFERVSFANADLRSTDLRLSTFVDCKFDGASMAGATLTEGLRSVLSLSSSQILEIGWTGSEGDEPEGG